MKKREVNDGTKAKISISTKLLRVLMPMVGIAIIFIIMFLSMEAKRIVSDTAEESLVNDSKKNAEKIGSEVTSLLSGYKQNVETIETLDFAGFRRGDREPSPVPCLPGKDLRRD